LRIRSLSSTSAGPSPELTSARSDLETSLSTLAEDLVDLIESVKAIESDPYKYGLEIEEVTRRKRLVEEVGGEVEDMREELQKRIEKAKGKQNGGFVEEEGRNGKGGDAYEEFEQEQQLRIMNEQDEQLDGVFHTVGNLRQQADDMGRELEEQAEMLEGVDNLADRVGGKLQTGIQKVGWIIRKNEDTMSSCCIGILILVLIILLILVLVI
jgi:member of the syntaxin family of t-SNAREs